MEHAASHELDLRPPDGPVALGLERSLDPRHVVVKRTVRTIAAIAVSGGTLIALVSTAFVASIETAWLVVAGGAWLALVVVLATLAAKWPQLVHAHSSYRVDLLGIEIRRGVWWRSTVSVPRSRVQHIDVSQGPLERRYGLGSLTIFTAGTEHSQVHLEGLDHGVALAIRDHLLPSGGDDAV